MLTIKFYDRKKLLPLLMSGITFHFMKRNMIRVVSLVSNEFMSA